MEIVTRTFLFFRNLFSTDVYDVAMRGSGGKTRHTTLNQCCMIRRNECKEKQQKHENSPKMERREGKKGKDRKATVQR